MAGIEIDHYHNPDFVTILKEVYQEFKDSFGDLEADVRMEQDGLTFIGVPTAMKRRLNPIGLRDSIARMFNIDYRYSILQVIGDNGSGYNAPARSIIRLSIISAVNSANLRRRPVVIEYGYTAGLHDINWVVNDTFAWIRGFETRALGHVVFQSAEAIEERNQEASADVRHFVLAYNQNETRFGDNTWLADSIMAPDFRDTLICVEGGPQAFFQAASVAVKMVTVVLICAGSQSLRKEDSADPDDCKKRFSAAHVLSQLKESYEQMVSCGAIQTEYKDDLRLVLGILLDRLVTEGVCITETQRLLVFDGLEKLLAMPASFSAIVSEYVEL